MRLSLADRILKGLLDIPDPPCLACTWKRYCAVNAVGCENFKAYINQDLPGSRYVKGVNEPWPRHGPKPIMALDQNDI